MARTISAGNTSSGSLSGLTGNSLTGNSAHTGTSTETPILKKRRQIRHFPTLQGFVLLLFGISMVIGPASQHSDLIAAVIGYSLLILVPIMSIGTLYAGWRMASRIRIRATYSTSAAPGIATKEFTRPRSERPFSLCLRLSETSLPPLFSLSLTPQFSQEVTTATWKITGQIRAGKDIEQSLSMPHRGYWTLSHIDCTVQDSFGLSKFSWQFQLHPSLRIPIFPQESPSKQIPIFTSDTTSGTEQIELQNRGGDLFDVKRYHPADGARRILWKVYAKSGELLSRHPEPSMRPEGTISTLVLAGKNDDALCSLVLTYLQGLEEEGFDFSLASDGHVTEFTGEPDIATSRVEAENLFLSTVWNSDQTTTEERMRTIQQLSEGQGGRQNAPLHLITIFVSIERLRESPFMTEALQLQEWLQQQHFESFWVILDSQMAENAIETAPLLTRALFWEEAPDTRQVPKGLDTADETRSRFITSCESRGLHYILIDNDRAERRQ